MVHLPGSDLHTANFNTKDRLSTTKSRVPRSIRLHQIGVTNPAPVHRFAGELCRRSTASPADLAGTPYVVLSLPAADQVRATVPTALSRQGTIAIVDTTTSEPQASRAMAELAAAHGAAFVDARCPAAAPAR